MLYQRTGGPDGGGYYSAVQGGNLVESPRVVLEPNRAYRICAMIRTQFDRNRSEVNFYLNEWTADRQMVYNRPIGLPATTDGWEPFQAEFTTSVIADVAEYRFGMNMYGPIGRDGNRFDLADVTLEALPLASVQPFARGEGVTFRGGAGSLPMRIATVRQTAESILVESTAARYRFDIKANTLELVQLLVEERPVATVAMDVSLTDLQVLQQDDHVVVLANEHVSFGVQCDGLVVLTVQDERGAQITVRSEIGGRWNRMRDHHLLARDDLGGFSVHPWVPPGSGVVPRSELLDDVDFADFKSGYGGSGADIWQFRSDDRLSDEKSGWQARWQVGSGERLGMSVMPCRPFDWESSFDDHYELLGHWNDSPDTIASSPASIFLLWEATPRAYALSYGDIEPRDPVNLKEQIDTIHLAGKRVTNYMSAYFFSRRDESFIQNVRRWRDEYGIDGVYSDSLPMLEQLRDVWRKQGHERYFYDQYYLPAAQRITGYRVGQTAMPIATEETNDGKHTIRLSVNDPLANIHYTINDDTPTAKDRTCEAPITLETNQMLQAIAIAGDLDPSRVPMWRKLSACESAGEGELESSNTKD